MNENLYAILAQHFPADPRAPCMVLGDGRVWTYGDMIHASARMANLLASLGLEPGDRVAVQVEKSPEALVLYLACLRAGTVFLPLNPAYQRHELAYFLADATPGLFVCRPQMRPLADELANELADQSHRAGARLQVLELDDAGRGSLIDAAAPHADEFATVARERGDLASIIYTSGTTGRSKGAMLTHGNLAANARVLHAYWHFQPGDVLLHMLPIFHVHGLFIATHCALMNGSPMLFEPKFDPRRALALLPQASVFMGVPTYYVRLLAEPGFDRAACVRMRLFISGSAPLLAETHEQFRRRCGHTILERYGMTEGGMFTSNPYAGERRAGTVGFPLPGTEVRIADAHDQPVACGAVGGIQVRGANVFAGYWNMPEKTAEEFTTDGWFKTGDLGKCDADGYISIVGRSKDLIISGGLNIYPKEIEEVIDALPGVVESAVVGLPDADFGEAVTAVVVRAGNAAAANLREAATGLSEAAAGLSEAGIIAALRQTLARFKVPKRIVFAADLPRNAMGKVQKNLLREALGSAQQDLLRNPVAKS